MNRWIPSLTCVFLLVFGGCAERQARKESAARMAELGVSSVPVAKIARGGRLEIAEVAELARRDVGDQEILAHLKRSRAVYTLAPAHEGYLNAAGLGREVIDHMAATPANFDARFFPKGYIPPGVCRPCYSRKYLK